MIRANKPISATQAEAFSRLDRKFQTQAASAGFFDLRWSDPYFCDYGRLRPVRKVTTQERPDMKVIVYAFGTEFRAMKDEFCVFLDAYEIAHVELQKQMADYDGELFKVKVITETYQQSVLVGQWIQFHAIIAAM